MILIAGILFFFIVGGFFEYSSYVRKIRQNAREKSISMGFFDRGPLGRILKSLSVIRVIPEDEKSRLASILHDGALVGMTLETEDEG